MTVAQLIKHLGNIIDDLENNYSEEMEVNVSCNTYGMSNYGKGFLACSKGFIDLNNPVKEEEW